MLFTKQGKKISCNKKFTFSILTLLIILTVILTFLGNIPTIDHSNDNDDALEIWLNNFFHFNYPYNGVTQLNMPLTIFPALPLYSIPFYILGNVGYQNIINILIIIFVIWNFSDNRRERNFGLLSLLICTPLFVSILLQSDHTTVAAFTILGLYLVYKNYFKLGSVIFGFLIATKGYIWFIIPTIIYYIFKKESFKNFKKSLLIIMVIPLIIVLPFIFWNPDIFLHYAPIGVVSTRFRIFGIAGIEFPLTILFSVLSLFSYLKTKNLFLSIFISYFLFEFIVPLRSEVLLSLSAIMLGIYLNKEKYEIK